MLALQAAKRPTLAYVLEVQYNTKRCSTQDGASLQSSLMSSSSCHSSGGVEVRSGRSFLQDRSKVEGFGDVLGRMAATEAVEGTPGSDAQARSLLNRFLGAQVLLTGVESMMASGGGQADTVVTETRTTTVTTTASSSDDVMEEESPLFGSVRDGSEVLVKGVDINSEHDQDKLRKLLDSCDAYDDRRKVRQRLKNLSASVTGGVSRTGVASSQSVTKQGGAQSSSRGSSSSSSLRSNNDIATVNSWLADNFPDHPQPNGRAGPRSSTQASSSSTTQTSQSTKVTKVSPFNKFQQLDAQQHTARPASQGRGATGGGQLFALSSSLKSSANSIKDILLTWCQCRTRDYKGIRIENFSTSWNDGLAFCALIHHFYPDAFDFDKLDAKNRRYNFDLAFRTADERAGVMALLDVEDMVMMKKPDWKCVFTYIQSLYKRLKDE